MQEASVDIDKWYNQKISYLKNEINSILQSRGLPICFGQMEVSVNHLIYSYQNYKTIYSSAKESEYKDFIERKVREYLLNVNKIAKCAKCDLFDRCAVISGMMGRIKK